MVFAVAGLYNWVSEGNSLTDSVLSSDEPPEFTGAIGFMLHGMVGTTLIPLVAVALLSGGHVLVDDVPGSGKTTLARAFARTVGGSTSCRYASGCAANSSHDGMETTRTFTRSAWRRRAAATATCTSEPVPIRIAWGTPPAGSSSV